MRTTFLSVSFFVVLLGAAHSATVILTPSEFIESKRTVIPVAGGVRKGSLASPGEANVDLSALEIALPPLERKKLCVSVDSRDATYHADIVYDLTTLTGGSYALKLRTKYSSELGRYTAAQLAVLAYVGSQCPGTAEMIVPVRWGGIAPDRSPFTVFINSGSDSAIVRLYDRDAGRYHECRRLTGEDVVSYDTECRFEPTVRGTTAKLVVLRSSFETEWPGVPLPLYIP